MLKVFYHARQDAGAQPRDKKLGARVDCIRDKQVKKGKMQVNQDSVHAEQEEK